MEHYPQPSFEKKICEPAQLKTVLQQLPRPLVFTNGCFDILHRGHVSYLDQARGLGSALLVALNSDTSVKRLGKGENRPINKLEDRLAIIAALASVDLVTWFDEDDPLNLIMQSKPNILAKGGDWPMDKIIGAQEVMSWGGKIYSIPFIHVRSTTDTIAKIRSL